MAISGNLVHMVSTTTGGSDFSLSPVNGKQSFVAAFSTGGADRFWYFISHQAAAEWEVGTGHLSAATTLVRDTVVQSSNANAAVTFSAGTKDVTSANPYSFESQVSVNAVNFPQFVCDVTGNPVQLHAMGDTNVDFILSAEGTGAVALAVQGGARRLEVNNTNAFPASNDLIALGAGLFGFSDLFLASGGIINWSNGNYTLTHSTGLLTANGALAIGTGNPFTCGTIELGDASDTTLSRISAGVAGVEGTALLRASQNLSDVGTAATAFGNIKQAATTTATGVTELAVDAEIWAATAGNLAITPSLISSASANVALSDAATVAVNWAAAINFTLTITANRILGNPTNGIAGTWRTVLVQGNDANLRTLTYGNQYGGVLPVLTDITSTKKYLLMIYCKSSTTFLVTAIDGS